MATFGDQKNSSLQLAEITPPVPKPVSFFPRMSHLLVTVQHKLANLHSYSGYNYTRFPIGQ